MANSNQPTVTRRGALTAMAVAPSALLAAPAEADFCLPELWQRQIAMRVANGSEYLRLGRITDDIKASLPPQCRVASVDQNRKLSPDQYFAHFKLSYDDADLVIRCDLETHCALKMRNLLKKESLAKAWAEERGIEQALGHERERQIASTNLLEFLQQEYALNDGVLGVCKEIEASPAHTPVGIAIKLAAYLSARTSHDGTEDADYEFRSPINIYRDIISTCALPDYLEQVRTIEREQWAEQEAAREVRDARTVTRFELTSARDGARLQTIGAA